MEHLPLAPLRFERLEVRLDELDALVLPGATAAEDELADRLFQLVRDTVEARLEVLGPQLDAVQLVGCRLTLTGRTRDHAALARVLRERVLQGREFHLGDTRFYLEKLIDEGQPALDLEELSAGSDPRAILARKLLAIQRDEPECRRLIADAQRELASEARRGTWASLQAEEGDAGDNAGEDGRPDGEARTRSRLIAACTRAIEALSAQTGGDR
jgi:hypothetical protein